MSNVVNDRRVDYLEFPALDIAAPKAFYEKIFGWKFTDYGADYSSFDDGRLSGGFYKAETIPAPGARVMIYAADFAFIEPAVGAAGGAIAKDVFVFPGRQRFHFTDPSGNELAVWSE